ncbi:MAG: ornithine cyclodeaminase family protein, partial [Stellaceae bacterium]
LEAALRLEAQGQAESMPKAHLMVGANDAIHAIGAAMAGAGLCGTKTWVNVGGKSETVLVLFDLADGRLRAVIEATALGQMRTAAMSGVGTRRLAAPDADELAVIGSGKQALPQAAAVAAVRTLKRIRVFSRRAEARNAFAKAARESLGIDTVAAPSLEAAVDGAPIVTLITNATEPFFTAAMAAKGAHINAMGAIVPARGEFADDVFARAALVAVDNIAQVRELSSEFRRHYGDDAAAWRTVRPIAELVAKDVARPQDADLTLFKAMGMGLSDLALGSAILAPAEAQGGAHRLPARVKLPPRLR